MKKIRYEEGKEEQKIWEQKQKEKRKMASAQDHLISAEGIAREKNSKGYRWLKDSFQKPFEELKTIDSETKEKIDFLEKRIKEKFVKIDLEINYKIEKYKAKNGRRF